MDVIAAPVYDVEGCGVSEQDDEWLRMDQPYYSSVFIVRASSDFAKLEDTAGKRLALNGYDSLSGFRCLVPLIGDPKHWFGACRISGSHRASARMVFDEVADVAAIDAVCWALLKKHEPNVVSALRVVGWSNRYPAPPFIIGRARTNEMKNKLPSVLQKAVSNASETQAIKSLFLKDILPANNSEYLSLSNL
ncbi:MAG: PhnD/SsuA/transferrin family substrate-binding protein [Pseudomonadota bacterium]